ncbi:MAG: hypothetical protein J5585_10760 [Clostridia bacterium]|nr:hypothetical protein [Clostridia bacterium]
MKAKGKSKTGNILRAVGLLLILTCWLMPAALTDSRVHIMILLYVMSCQVFVGGVIYRTGVTVKKNKEDDPYYNVPKNPFRLFRGWQLGLFAVLIAFYAALFLCRYVTGKFDVIFPLVFLASPVIVITAAIIRQKKNVNMPRSSGGRALRGNTSTAPTLRCNGCNKEITSSDGKYFDGRAYCSSCFLKKIAEREETGGEKSEETQMKCSVCGKEFPPSALSVINDKVYCGDCFAREYPPEL